MTLTAMAPQFAYIMNRRLQPDRNVLRIHILQVMKMKPCLHDGTVKVDTDNNSRLVEIPPNDGEPPGVGLSTIW